jgi:hypothetical protein
MVRDAPRAALLTMRIQDFTARESLIQRSPRSGRLEGWPQDKLAESESEA